MIKVEDNIFVYDTAFQKKYFLKKYLDDNKNPQNNFPVINVVGTNGKGSVSSYLSHGLKNKYKSVGLFISPAFLYHNERIQINNIPISDEDLYRIIENSKDEIIKYKLTFFEIWTLIAIKYFNEKHVDIAVIEAGIGGKLDATNVFENQVAVAITSIDFDHTEILGNTIEEIIAQKSGIVKKETKVFIANDNLQYENLFKKYLIDSNFIFSNISIEKIGYQKINYGLSCELLKYLGIDFKKNDSNVEPKGRMTILQDEPKIILDGCHNVLGVKKMIESVKDYNKNFKVLFATSLKKDYEEMIYLLRENFEDVFLTEFDHIKSWKIPNELKKSKILNWKKFLEINKKNDLIICGSLYFVPLVYEYFQKGC